MTKTYMRRKQTMNEDISVAYKKGFNDCLKLSRSAKSVGVYGLGELYDGTLCSFCKSKNHPSYLHEVAVQNDDD